MTRVRMVLVVLMIAAAAIGARGFEQASDRVAVERAVLDYVEAIYEVKPELVDRSVHRELAKRGFFRGQDSTYRESTMSFAQLRTLSERWNAQGRVNAKTARKKVVVLDLLDNTASAKLIAHWGVDYMHLAKYDGQWKIVNILWQTGK